MAGNSGEPKWLDWLTLLRRSEASTCKAFPSRFMEFGQRACPSARSLPRLAKADDRGRSASPNNCWRWEAKPSPPSSRPDVAIRVMMQPRALADKLSLDAQADLLATILRLTATKGRRPFRREADGARGHPRRRPIRYGAGFKIAEAIDALIGANYPPADVWASERMTFRTTFRETPRSRQIALIAWP